MMYRAWASRFRWAPIITALGVGGGAMAAPVAAAKSDFRRIATIEGNTHQVVAMARTPNGALHLVFQTGNSGLAAESISKAGAPGPLVQATTWAAGKPGLVAYSNGTLQAFFGAIRSDGVSSVWGITSSNGGASWSAPTDVRDPANTPLAYASDVTSVLSAGTPILSLPQAGGIVIQRGLGPSAPTYQLTTPADGWATDADLAVDAATQEVVAGWRSGSANNGDWLQGAAPAVGVAQKVPGQDDQAIIPSGRDKGAGVWAAYTPDGTHLRLLRYGGGSIAVGAIPGLQAKALGTATGLGGRIWVFWGTDAGNSGVAVTRSNRAVTRFEPIQRLNPNAFTLWRLSGDGRLGPLDLFADQMPNGKTVVPPGNYYARVLPVLSASPSVKALKNGKGQVIAHYLTVKVTDAGDVVAGATVAAAGKKAKTNASGVAKLVLPGGQTGFATVTVTDSGYRPLKLRVKL